MVASSRITIREVVRSSDPAAGKAHELISRTFRKTELVGRTEWRHTLREREAGFESDTRWHLVVAEMAGAVIGVATGTYLGDVNTGVVGYLAVARAARGLGIGPKLRSRLRGRFRRDARQVRREPLRAVVGEVRRGNPWLRTLIRRDRVLALNFGYFQPRLRPGARSIRLILYYESLDRVRHRLPTALIRRLLYTTWQRIYRIARPLSNPAFRRMLAELDGRASIGKLRLEDLPALEGGNSHR
jgi:GNAT superfamily N-acetyltransferase